MTATTWTVRSGYGRKAHRSLQGRRTACGTHLGYGNLIHDPVDTPYLLLCGRCYPTATTQEPTHA